MSDQLLTVLKLCLLALLYLFFFRVIRAVWAELAEPAPAARPAPTPAPVASAVAGAPGGAPARSRGASPASLVIVDPPELRARSWPIDQSVTLGRAASCTITLDDSFASQQHAQVSHRSGQYVVEDLGSTNGTYVNRQRVAAPTVMNPGDRMQIGNTVFELV